MYLWVVNKADVYMEQDKKSRNEDSYPAFFLALYMKIGEVRIRKVIGEKVILKK